MTDFPSVVDAQWLREHLDDLDLVVGDVRGPNAHMRGHIPGSRPLVLGSPMPMSDAESAHAFAQEVALRLRRHGVTGDLAAYSVKSQVGHVMLSATVEAAADLDVQVFHRFAPLKTFFLEALAQLRGQTARR